MSKRETKKYVILTAGGIGTRMGQDIPKQFLTINDKPVIVYTMEIFQQHPDIDGIIIVCLDGWQDIMEAYIKQFNITKVVDVVVGGASGQESIKNGLEAAKKHLKDDDIIIIHDGNRPMLSQDIISDNIATCCKNGNAITYIPALEVLFLEDGDDLGLLDRDKVLRTQTPHSFVFADLLKAMEEGTKKGFTSEVACCSLYQKLGKKLYFSLGSEKNIKLTRKDDIDIFKALLNIEREDWYK